MDLAKVAFLSWNRATGRFHVFVVGFLCLRSGGNRDEGLVGRGGGRHTSYAIEEELEHSICHGLASKKHPQK